MLLVWDAPWMHFGLLGGSWETFRLSLETFCLFGKLLGIILDTYCLARSTQHTGHSTEQRAESTEHTAQSTKHRAHSKEHIAKSTEHTAKHTAPIRQQCTIETALLEQNHPLTGFVGPSCFQCEKNRKTSIKKTIRAIPSDGSVVLRRPPGR